MSNLNHNENLAHGRSEELRRLCEDTDSRVPACGTDVAGLSCDRDPQADPRNFDSRIGNFGGANFQFIGRHQARFDKNEPSISHRVAGRSSSLP